LTRGGRQLVVWLALAVIAFVAFLTVRVMVADGFDVLVFLSLVILAILGFGVLGALGSSDE
jgi:hypothetical protein